MGWWIALVVIATMGCRGAFEEIVPGLAEDVPGVMVTPPGALVLEDGRYDLGPAIDRRGYALAYAAYPPGDPTLELHFAVFGEDGEAVVAPRLIEIFPSMARSVRLWTGRDHYLVVTLTDQDCIVLVIDAGGTTVNRYEESNYDGDPTAVATDTGFAFGFVSTSLVQVQLLDHGGIPTSAPVILDSASTNSQYNPVLAWIGGEVVAVFGESLPTGQNTLRRARVDAAGQLVAGTLEPFYDQGSAEQGTAYLGVDGSGGLYASWDRYVSNPRYVLRLTADASPVWAQPVEVFDDLRYHETADISVATDGTVGVTWITDAEQQLTNVYFTALLAGGATPPAVPAPRLLTDPQYEFCYPEVARASASFGVAFAGEVLGSVGLFLAIVPD